MKVWSHASECPGLQQPERRPGAPESLGCVFWVNVKVTVGRDYIQKERWLFAQGSYLLFGAESLLCIECSCSVCHAKHHLEWLHT